MSGFGPVSSAPVSSPGGYVPVTVTEMLTAAAVTSATSWLKTIVPTIEASVPGDDAYVGGYINLVEAVAVQAALVHTGVLLQSEAEVSVPEAVSVLVTRLLLIEEVTTAAELVAVRRQIEAVIEVVHAIGLVDSIATARELVVAALVVEALATRGAREDLSAAAVTAAYADHYQHLIESALDSVEVEAVATERARFTLLVDDSTVTAAEATNKAHLFEALLAQSVAVATLNLPGGDSYTAWVLNADSAAASYYTNFPFFAGMTEYEGRYFGIAPGGLYEFDGTDDAGTPFTPLLKTALLNFGSAMKKRMAVAYLHFGSPGEVVIKMTAIDEGQKVECWYQLEGRGGLAVHPDRIDKLDKGLEALHFQFEVTTLAGAPINVDGMRVVPVLLNRRI